MTAQRIGASRLAQATGIDVRMIRKYRAGDSEPRDYFGYPTENGIKIADALDVDVDELLPVTESEAA